MKRLGRLAPGKLFLVDLEQGRIVDDEEVKREVATQQPYGEWYDDNVVHFDDLEPAHVTHDRRRAQPHPPRWPSATRRRTCAS